MPTSFIVVDDFLDNADALRRAALKLSYPPQRGMFPGRNSIERIAIGGLDERISALVGEPLRGLAPGQAHGKSRITLANDQGLARVHVDAAHWSGILYLSRPEHSQGGTEFFKHLPTGTDRAPYNDDEARAYGFATAKEMTTRVMEDTVDDAKWERLFQVPMRFNRLLLLRPWFWHTAGPSFGDTLDNGRLVYLMFFESAPAST